MRRTAARTRAGRTARGPRPRPVGRIRTGAPRGRPDGPGQGCESRDAKCQNPRTAKGDSLHEGRLALRRQEKSPCSRRVRASGTGPGTGQPACPGNRSTGVRGGHGASTLTWSCWGRSARSGPRTRCGHGDRRPRPGGIRHRGMRTSWAVVLIHPFCPGESPSTVTARRKKRPPTPPPCRLRRVQPLRPGPDEALPLRGPARGQRARPGRRGEARSARQGRRRAAGHREVRHGYGSLGAGRHVGAGGGRRDRRGRRPRRDRFVLRDGADRPHGRRRRRTRRRSGSSPYAAAVPRTTPDDGVPGPAAGRPAHCSGQRRTPGSTTRGFSPERVTRTRLALSARRTEVIHAGAAVTDRARPEPLPPAGPGRPRAKPRPYRGRTGRSCVVHGPEVLVLLEIRCLEGVRRRRRRHRGGTGGGSFRSGERRGQVDGGSPGRQ